MLTLFVYRWHKKDGWSPWQIVHSSGMLCLGKTIYHGIKNSHFASSVYRPLHVPEDVNRTISQGRFHGNQCPILSKTYPLSHVLQRRSQRMTDLNYFFFVTTDRDWPLTLVTYAKSKNEVVVSVGILVIWKQMKAMPKTSLVPAHTVSTVSKSIHNFTFLCNSSRSIIIPF